MRRFLLVVTICLSLGVSGCVCCPWIAPPTPTVPPGATYPGAGPTSSSQEDGDGQDETPVELGEVECEVDKVWLWRQLEDEDAYEVSGAATLHDQDAVWTDDVGKALLKFEDVWVRLYRDGGLRLQSLSATEGEILHDVGTLLCGANPEGQVRVSIDTGRAVVEATSTLFVVTSDPDAGVTLLWTLEGVARIASRQPDGSLGAWQEVGANTWSVVVAGEAPTPPRPTTDMADVLAELGLHDLMEEVRSDVVSGNFTPPGVRIPTESEVSPLREERVLRVAAGAPPSTWDPALAASSEVLYLSNVYEPLLWMEPDGALQPGLARSWDISDDGRVWTFYLQEGVAFHDGELLTAEVVQASIERTIEWAGPPARIWERLDSVEVVDDLTVRFVLSQPAPLERIVSAPYGAWIVSPAAVWESSDWFDAGREAGSGPWQLESYTPGQQMVLARYRDYWRGWEAGQFDRVVISIVPDEAARAELLAAGEVDLALPLPGYVMEHFQGDARFEVNTTQTFESLLAFLNTQRPPLDDLRVRQAVAWAFSYLEVASTGNGPLAIQARGPVPLDLWPHHSYVNSYGYDPGASAELLAEAGYGPGDINLVLTYNMENPQQERVAPLLAEALGEVGIVVQLKGLSAAEQLALARGNPASAQDILLGFERPLSNDGYDLLSGLFACRNAGRSNLSYYCNGEYDERVGAAFTMSVYDPGTAQEAYLEAMNLLVEESPALFLYNVQGLHAVPNDLQGYRPNPYYGDTAPFYPLAR